MAVKPLHCGEGVSIEIEQREYYLRIIRLLERIAHGTSPALPIPAKSYALKRVSIESGRSFPKTAMLKALKDVHSE